MASISNPEQIKSRDHCQIDQSFPFLSLPFELRLKIYALVLPSRTHTIATQYPHNGYYYSAIDMNTHPTQTLYAAQPYVGPPPAMDLQKKLTTYKLLNANSHRDFPSSSISPKILRTCKQIKHEAEPVLYGAESIFDFGVYVDAIVPFLKDRSAIARRVIRHVSIGREIPVTLNLAQKTDERPGHPNHADGAVTDALWNTTSAFLRDHCVGLRTVNLTLWAENGGFLEDALAQVIGSAFDLQNVGEPSASFVAEYKDVHEHSMYIAKDAKLWRQWEWTKYLLTVETLRHVKVTWWAFVPGSTDGKFHGWLGRRMVADKFVRDRMICEGRMTECITTVPGDWYSSLVQT